MEIYSYTLLAISYDISSLELYTYIKGNSDILRAVDLISPNFISGVMTFILTEGVQCVNNQYFVHTKYIYYVPNYMSFLILNLNSLACSIFV